MGEDPAPWRTPAVRALPWLVFSVCPLRPARSVQGHTQHPPCGSLDSISFF